MNSNSRNLALHQNIMSKLMRRYEKPLIDNVYRSDYVEWLVVLTIGSGWKLTWDWAPWDCKHKSNKARLEVKQSAVRQPWDCETLAPRRSPRFDIKPRKYFWTEDGETKPVNPPRRLANIYVFAWHDERRHGCADHRDANQWVFYVVAEQDLPKNKEGIGLRGLNSIVSPCRIVNLKSAVESACPAK